MEREKKILLLSHCIINQNSVVFPLARAKGPFPFVDTIIKNNIGIYQLPCPEFKFGGLNRPSQTKEEYDTKEFRDLCKTLSSDVVKDIKEYLKHDFQLLGIIGIENSPTCSISGKRGIFIEELFDNLAANNIKLDYIEIPSGYEENLESISKINYELLNIIYKK